MSKWQQWEEQQVSGADENTPLVSRCHQVLQEHQWSSQVYLDIINLILIQHSAQVVLLAGVNTTMTTKVKGSKWKENFPGATGHDPVLQTIRLGD